MSATDIVVPEIPSLLSESDTNSHCCAIGVVTDAIDMEQKLLNISGDSFNIIAE
jgi:hypothetical protein